MNIVDMNGQPRLDSKVTPKSTTWLTRCILFSSGKLYFEEAFFWAPENNFLSLAGINYQLII